MKIDNENKYEETDIKEFMKEMKGKKEFDKMDITEDFTYKPSEKDILFLYKVKEPAKFAILFRDKETASYIVANSQTKRIFKISIKEFLQRFEPINITLTQEE